VTQTVTDFTPLLLGAALLPLFSYVFVRQEINRYYDFVNDQL
jgi:hypothetical protein